MMKRVMGKAAQAVKDAVAAQKKSGAAAPAAPRGMSGALSRAVSAGKKSGVATPDAAAKAAPPKGMMGKAMSAAAKSGMLKRSGPARLAKGGMAKKGCK